MIDVARRLRRAILRNDLTLVQRIVRNDPSTLQNADFEDKSNTSLHLAAKEGFVEIARFLIEAGHENSGISLNADWDTPLMLAAANRRVDVGEVLVKLFPRCAPWTNKAGMDALMLSSRHGTTPLIPKLLTSPSPPSVSAHDRDGNTALHHASAAGELKALRLLLQFGASPLAQNAYSWTPIAYSATAAAEQYFKTLISEIESQYRPSSSHSQSNPPSQSQSQSQPPSQSHPTPPPPITRAHAQRRPGPGPGAVRLVTSDDMIKPGHPTEGSGRSHPRPHRTSDAASNSNSNSSIRAVDARASLDDEILPAPPRMDSWSPVEQRRAMTPTAGRSEGWNGVGVVAGMVAGRAAASALRARASSGD